MSSNILIPSLPKALEPVAAELHDACNVALLAAWPEDPKPTYTDAAQPAAIARCLRKVIHDNLAGAEIAWLFKETLGDTLGAKMARASGAQGHLAEVDFYCVVSWEKWRMLSHRARVALVDHELCHCSKDVDSGKYVIVEHDIEEFTAIAARWGTWRLELKRFRDALKSSQYELGLETASPKQ